MIQNTKNKRVLLLVLIFLILICTSFQIIESKLLFLPEGTIIETLNSPNGDYTMNAYFIDGGPISANAIRVEIIDNKNGKSKNIYYSYPNDSVILEWIDNDYVKINGIQLDIHKDYYKEN